MLIIKIETEFFFEVEIKVFHCQKSQSNFPLYLLFLFFFQCFWYSLNFSPKFNKFFSIDNNYLPHDML